jgi:methylmalonyl-CoA mutase
LEKLTSPTPEGVVVRPIYGREDLATVPHAAGLPGQSPFVRGRWALGYLGQPWLVRSDPVASSPVEWNRVAREELDGGATALGMLLDAASDAGLGPEDEVTVGSLGRGGPALSSRADLDAALQNIDLARVPLLLESATSGLCLGALLAALARDRGVPLARLQGGLGLDPLGALASQGRLSAPLTMLLDEMAEAMAWSGERAPLWHVAVVHAAPFHEGGGTAVQELAFAVATAAEYLRAMIDRGLSAALAASKIAFCFPVGTRLYTEVAKLRAARCLWDAVAGAFGCAAPARAAVVHVRSSEWTKSRLDPWVNMIRATVETFAALGGGADSVSVLPFDGVAGAADTFSRRQARNIQLILREESQLARVCDPGGGSFYLESLTDSLARAAWTLFQEVERRGGMAAALLSGFPQGEIVAAGVRRARGIAHGEEPRVGVNKYASLVEESRPASEGQGAAQRRQRAEASPSSRGGGDNAALERRLQALAPGAPGVPGARMAAAVEAAAAGVTLDELRRALRPSSSGPVTAPIIPRLRAAEPFERLRAAAAAHQARVGARPGALVVPVGSAAALRGRVEFARAFLEVGGFSVTLGEVVASAQAAVHLARAQGIRVVVLCAADSDYPDLVPEVARLLRQGSPGSVVAVAGPPPADRREPWVSEVEAFVHRNGDAVEVMAQLQRAAGVEVRP